jgi:hypothetical protein
MDVEGLQPAKIGHFEQNTVSYTARVFFAQSPQLKIITFSAA